MSADVDLVTSAGGNLGSITRCLTRLGISYNLTGPDNPPNGTLPIILPGVGHFGTVMNSLSERGFDATVRDAVKSGVPFLGVCVGMQVLFDASDEAPGVKGLGLIPGTVRKFQNGKVPQIGWNEVSPQNDPSWPKGSSISSIPIIVSRLSQPPHFTNLNILVRFVRQSKSIT